MFHPRFKPNTNQVLPLESSHSVVCWRTTLHSGGLTVTDFYYGKNLWIKLNIIIWIWILTFLDKLVYPFRSPCPGLHIGCPHDQCLNSKLVQTTNFSGFVPGVLFAWKPRSQGTVSWRCRCFWCTASYVKFCSVLRPDTCFLHTAAHHWYVWCGSVCLTKVVVFDRISLVKQAPRRAV